MSKVTIQTIQVAIDIWPIWAAAAAYLHQAWKAWKGEA